MRTIQLDPLTDSRWQTFIGSARGASVFHHPAWLGLVGSRYRYAMTALCVVGDDGAIAAGIPLARVNSRLTGRRLVAVPFSDVCPPAYAAGHPHAEAGGDVVAGRGFERAGAIAEDELARFGGAHHQDLVDLLADVEFTNAHEGKP